MFKVGDHEFPDTPLNRAILRLFNEMDDDGDGHIDDVEGIAIARMLSGNPSLAQEWGAEAEANFERARRAVLALELDERELASLAAAMGSDAGLLRLLSRLGPRLGEDTAVGRGRDPLALSPGQAQARIERIYQDPGHAYHDGDHPEHAAAVQEMLRLNEVLHGEG